MRSSAHSSTHSLPARFDRSTRQLSTPAPVSQTFGAYAEHWLDAQIGLARAGLIRANTIARFESALSAHLLPFFAGYELEEVTRERC